MARHEKHLSDLINDHMLPEWYRHPNRLTQSQPISKLSTFLYFIFLVPRIIFGVSLCLFLYITMGITLYVHQQVQLTSRVRSRSSQHYMMYFILLLSLVFKYQQARSLPSVWGVITRFNNNLSILYKAYEIIMGVDDLFDLSPAVQIKDKHKKLNDIFQVINDYIAQISNKDIVDKYDGSSECLNQSVSGQIATFLDKLPEVNLNEQQRNLILQIIGRCKMSYSIEINSCSSCDYWMVLRTQSFALTELCFVASMCICGEILHLNRYNQYLPMVQSFSHVMLMGNIADDWMDYFWTGEDVNQPCYINSILREKELTHKSRVYQYFYILTHMLGRVSLEVGVHQYKSRVYPTLSWLIPSQAILSLLTGPLNILHWLLSKK